MGLSSQTPGSGMLIRGSVGGPGAHRGSKDEGIG